MTPPRQLPLDLSHQPALEKDDFLVSDSNRAAFRAACDPTLGAAGRLILTGPEGSGKTHLCAIWARDGGAAVLSASDLDRAAVEALMGGGAVAIEDADRIAGHRSGEHLLFHALNLAAAHGARLLITGRSAPARWGVTMPDLASRLTALPHVAIGSPDDTLLSSILDKLFSERQISASADAIRFLLPRMDRSFAAAVKIVEELDRRSLAEQRRITRAFVRDVYHADPEIVAGTREP